MVPWWNHNVFNFEAPMSRGQAGWNIQDQDRVLSAILNTELNSAYQIRDYQSIIFRQTLDRV